jgi:peroxiredoxin
LLSDVDHAVGLAYHVVRPADHQYADYPERHSYLIDDEGVIRRAYAVTDVAAHAADVLADLEELQR